MKGGGSELWINVTMDFGPIRALSLYRTPISDLLLAAFGFTSAPKIKSL